MNKTELVKKLYICVDNLDVAGLASYFAEDIKFKFSNFDELIGKEAALDSNRAFFSSVKAMQHTIDNVWVDGADLICNGSVDYTRHDLTKHNVAFATILKIKNSKIRDFLIYADVSLL